MRFVLLAALAFPTTLVSQTQRPRVPMDSARAAALYERFDQTRGGANLSEPGLGSYSTASFTLGNPEVDPEIADTYTFGAVFQPGGFADGFQASIDYYSISIQDAINVLTAQRLMRRICTKCIRGGRVQKAVVRKLFSLPNAG